jgi:superfamily II DNA/RNA helicase
MTPTRELAKQVSDTFEMICDTLTVLCVYGGTPIMPQGNENTSLFKINIGCCMLYLLSLIESIMSIFF